MVQLIGQKAMNLVVSHLPECSEATHSKAKEVGGVAEARLSAHRHSGHAQVTVTTGDTDAFVNLEDEAALSIEFGHMVKGKFERDTPKKVLGLYIITGAAGLAG